MINKKILRERTDDALCSATPCSSPLERSFSSEVRSMGTVPHFPFVFQTSSVVMRIFQKFWVKILPLLIYSPEVLGEGKNVGKCHLLIFVSFLLFLFVLRISSWSASGQVVQMSELSVISHKKGYVVWNYYHY